MKKTFFSLFFLSCCLTSTASYADYSLLPQGEEAQKLVMNNRILAKVNGKTISVLDVMKKMDVFLSRYYPELAGSQGARFQYFSTQWKETLRQMIDNELMMADAEKLELKVTDAEVRESVIERFGPNVMTNLDKLNLTYEEARKMVYSDLVVQKMTWYRIHSKALQNVNPQDIKIAYQEYCAKNPVQEKWDYQVLSIRTKDDKLGEALAQKAYSLLQMSPEALPVVLDEIKKEIGDTADVSVTLSEEYKTSEKTISDAHKQVLMKLVSDSISEPIRQLSRFDRSIVYRIFHLKNHTKSGLVSFAQVADKLRDELLDKAVVKESEEYISKLREKFGYDAKALQESIPNDFQPFVLK